jgi:sugar phosphate isomerase/epimerase
VSVTRILPPDEWRKRQLETLRAVGQRNYTQGIGRPKKDPIEAGREAEEKWAERIREAIEEKRRAKALQATNMNEWYKYASEIGAGRLVEGVTKREAKVDRFVKAWQPLLLDHVGKVDAMPAVTDADMEARMLENLRGLKALKGKWRG